MRSSRLLVCAAFVCLLAVVGGCPQPLIVLDDPFVYACNVVLNVQVIYDDDGSPVYAEPVWFTAVKWATKPRLERAADSEFGPIIKYTNETGAARQQFGYYLGGWYDQHADLTATLTIAGREYTATESFYPDRNQDREDTQLLAKTVMIRIVRPD